MDRRQQKTRSAIFQAFTRLLEKKHYNNFTEYPSYLRPGVPEDLALRHLISSFAETVKWWTDQKMHVPPEKLAGYYMKLILI